MLLCFAKSRLGNWPYKLISRNNFQSPFSFFHTTRYFPFPVELPLLYFSSYLPNAAKNSLSVEIEVVVQTMFLVSFLIVLRIIFPQPKRISLPFNEPKDAPYAYILIRAIESPVKKCFENCRSGLSIIGTAF